jgi:hypothetical protein
MRSLFAKTILLIAILVGFFAPASRSVASFCPSSLAAKTAAPNLGKVSDDILEWIEPKSTMSKPPGGSDLILRSADGTRQIRFDLTNPHGLQPHVNVETFVPRNLFPGDRKMIQTVNEHVFPKP